MTFSTKLPSKFKRFSSAKNSFIFECIDEKLKKISNVVVPDTRKEVILPSTKLEDVSSSAKANNPSTENEGNLLPTEPKVELSLKRSLNHLSSHIPSKLATLQTNLTVSFTAKKSVSSDEKTVSFENSTTVSEKEVKSLIKPLPVSKLTSKVPSLYNKKSNVTLQSLSNRTSSSSKLPALKKSASESPIMKNSKSSMSCIKSSASSRTGSIKVVSRVKSSVNKITPNRSCSQFSSRAEFTKLRKPVKIQRSYLKKTPVENKNSLYRLKADNLLTQLEIQVFEEELSTLETLIQECKDTLNDKEDNLAQKILEFKSVEEDYSQEINQEKNDIDKLDKDIVLEQEKRSNLTKAILELNEEIKKIDMENETFKEMMETCSDKRDHIKLLIPQMVSKLNSVIDTIKAQEDKMASDLLACTKNITRCHLVSMNIRWVCRIYNEQGPSKSNVKIAIPLDKPAISSNAQQDMNEHTAASNFKKSTSFEEDTISFPIVVKHTESSKTSDESLKALPVTGEPHSWVSIQDNPKYSCPFDQVILFDPTLKPHTLIITPWESIEYPLENLENKIFNEIALLDYPEQTNILNLCGDIMDEFLSDIPYPGNRLKPSHLSFICLGASSARSLTFWGSENPRKVCFESFYDYDFDKTKEKMENTNNEKKKLEGILCLIINKLNAYINNIQDEEWCIEVAYENNMADEKTVTESIDKENKIPEKTSLDNLLKDIASISCDTQLKGNTNVSDSCVLLLNQRNIYSHANTSEYLDDVSSIKEIDAISPLSAIEKKQEPVLKDPVFVNCTDFQNLETRIKKNCLEGSTALIIRIFPKKDGISSALNLLLIDAELPKINYRNQNFTENMNIEFIDPTINEIFEELSYFNVSEKPCKSKLSIESGKINELKTYSGQCMNYFNRSLESSKSKRRMCYYFYTF